VAIVPCGKDKWRLILPLPRDPGTGKRRQRWLSFSGNKRQAQKEYDRLLEMIEIGQDSSRLTAAMFFDEWTSKLEATHSVKASTLVRYKELLSALKPLIGATKLAKLDATLIQNAYGRVLASGRSKKTLLNVHRVLHQALADAVREKRIATNPAADFKGPRAPQYHPRILDVDDIARILDVADKTRYSVLVRLLVYTGLRVGEALGLTWDSVDMERGVLFVRQTARRERGIGVTVGTPKTHRSLRPVSLSPVIVDCLRVHRIEQAQERLRLGPMYVERGFLFSRRGQALDGTYVSRDWRKIAKDAGVEGARLHDLRHAHASVMLKAGIAAKVVSERLGHSRIGITLDTYSHVLPGLQDDAAAKFEAEMRRFG
jgi:integrase